LPVQIMIPGFFCEGDHIARSCVDFETMSWRFS
jgi:hypothetical protein